MRKLATCRVIAEIKAIPKADKIQAYRVDNWWVVDGKDKYKVGDKVVYFEVDSFLPEKPEFEFLRKNSYKEMANGERGFRLRSIMLQKQLSQGLLMPLDFEASVGEDLTEKIGVRLYEPPIPAELHGDVAGGMPGLIPKTDEERIQNLDVNQYAGKRAYISEKLDGTSATVYYIKSEKRFGVCGRNWEFKESETNTFWRVVRDADIQKKLQDFDKSIAIQGELIGFGIQQNIYRVNHQIRFFTAYDIEKGQRLLLHELEELMQYFQLPMVPILDRNFIIPNTCDEILALAEGTSQLNSKINREGVVIRGVDENFSFKAISNSYLLKYSTV